MIRASSRYCCPIPFTESNLSLIVLSTNLTKQPISFGCSPCLLAFHSVHTVCIVACKAYRKIKVFVGLSLGLECNTLSTFQSVMKSSCIRPSISFLHICPENRQPKNRWQTDSCSSLHKTQVMLIAMFQCCIISVVCSLSRITTQRRNAYFGVE